MTTYKKLLEVPEIVKEGLHYDIPSNEYHTIPNTFSSSQLKAAWEDIELFHAKYILKTIEKEENPAFDLGTYVHTAVLEPEKLTLECAVYDGIRRGAAWDKFKIENAGKAIISKSEFATAETLIKAINSSPIAMGRIGRSTSEVTAFLMIRVHQGELYAVTWGKRLGKYGWVDAKVPSSGVTFWVKCRADKWHETFILDIKTTTGNAKNQYAMRTKISNTQYDLSAAMYLDVFSAAEQKIKSDFIWTFASKDYGNCKNYLAHTDNILIGRAKWKTAAVRIAEGFETNWVFEDAMGILAPQAFEYENIKEKAEDIL